jgi:heme/copper-type cytochrome/quinol oxidase subunit 3/mono/diheme cytochrome c family protein
MNQSDTDSQAQPHNKNLAHHFGSLGQQFSAAKLGMWTFLATEILMFGGLFCAYAVYRSNHPEIFTAGSYFLDTNMGALNTLVLIASSFTMAWAVRCAQLNKQRALVILLILTFLGGVVFMGIKFMEYKTKWEHGLTLGQFYNPDEAYFAAHVNGEKGESTDTQEHETQAEAPAPDPTEYVPSVARGQMVFSGTCSSCHNSDGTGMVNQGANLHEGGFVTSKDDKEMLTFLKLGRQSWDADSKMKLQMPPRGGNPALNDESLQDVIAYLRVLVKENPTAKENKAKDNEAEQPDPTGYVPNVTRGRMVYSGTCASCHGPDGGGVPNQGASFHEGGFIDSKNDTELLAFVKAGRRSGAPDSKMKLQMPPKGGNMALTDENLKDMIAYLRVLVNENPTAGGAAGQPGSADTGGPLVLTDADLALLIPRTNIVPPTLASQELGEAYFLNKEPVVSHDPDVKPEDLRMFFAIYFLLTGLHGFHVLIGMFVMLWLIVRSLKGHFNSDYYTPVDMGGLYWHLVDLIWIFVFPLLYLIH